MESKRKPDNSSEAFGSNDKEMKELAGDAVENGDTSSDQDYLEQTPIFPQPLWEHCRTEAATWDKNVIRYLPLHKAAIKGDWEAAKTIFDKDPEAAIAQITVFRETALHIAVGAGKSTRFVRGLVSLMSPESLEMRDMNDDTPLHNACSLGYAEAAKILVNRNSRLPLLPNKYNHDTPIHYAAALGCEQTLWFLLSVPSYPTKDDEVDPFTGKSGLRLLNLLIMADLYGIALYLLRKYPRLAIEEDDDKGYTALRTLAQKPHAFVSGSRLGVFQWLLYKRQFLHHIELSSFIYDRTNIKRQQS